MSYQPYKIFKFEVIVRVRHDQNIIDAVDKLNKGEWENVD